MGAERSAGLAGTVCHGLVEDRPVVVGRAHVLRADVAVGAGQGRSRDLLIIAGMMDDDVGAAIGVMVNELWPGPNCPLAVLLARSGSGDFDHDFGSRRSASLAAASWPIQSLESVALAK